MPIGRAPPGVELSDDEQAAADSAAAFQAVETGYQQIQGTKPQTLGYGLNDSPAGLLACALPPSPLSAHGKLKGQIGAGITEKFHVWSDLGDDDDTPGATGLLSAYTMDGARPSLLLLVRYPASAG